MLGMSVLSDLIGAAKAAHPSMSDLLTPRQLESAILMANGYSDKEIAKELGISTKTVQQHTWAVHRKLGITSGNGRKANVSLCKRALREGLIDIDERVA